MGRYITITNTNFNVPGRRQATIRKQVQTGPISLTVITFAILGLFCLLYLGQMFYTNNHSYKINDLEKTQNQLAEQNRKLELQVADLQSYKGLKEESAKLNMVPAKNIIYLTPKDTSVAQANR